MDVAQRFGGVARLYGRSGLERLQKAHVCVVGVGGVGSWAVEALARTGVGEITMVDLDEVCVTNTNRQLPALTETFGQPKVAVLAERVRSINPDCVVHPEQEFFTSATAPRILSQPYDWVIDAIDVPVHKCLLIASCVQRELPVFTVGAAGGRRDATALKLSDLAHSENDVLLRVVRRELRRDHGFPKELGRSFGVPCVYSPEAPVFPWADGSVCATKEAGGPLTMDCASGFGSAIFVTGAFGFAAAGEVVRRIALGNAPVAK